MDTQEVHRCLCVTLWPCMFINALSSQGPGGHHLRVCAGQELFQHSVCTHSVSTHWLCDKQASKTSKSRSVQKQNCNFRRYQKVSCALPRLLHPLLMCKGSAKDPCPKGSLSKWKQELIRHRCRLDVAPSHIGGLTVQLLKFLQPSLKITHKLKGASFSQVCSALRDVCCV